MSGLQTPQHSPSEQEGEANKRAWKSPRPGALPSFAGLARSWVRVVVDRIGCALGAVRVQGSVPGNGTVAARAAAVRPQMRRVGTWCGTHWKRAYAFSTFSVSPEGAAATAWVP